MVFKATFNNISVLSWKSVLMVEETGKNHRFTPHFGFMSFHVYMYNRFSVEHIVVAVIVW
jgi:hypothetical protein